MRSKLVGYVIALTLSLGLSAGSMAQPKSKGSGSEAGSDKSIEKQSAWEQKVMGEDSAKKSDMRKIAAAQKLADEARKHPAPIAAPKVKDPSKEGARAKQEASIGLPIASDEATRSSKKGSAGGGNASARKPAAPTSSANDALGSLVASSLAEDKAATSGTRTSSVGDRAAAGRSGDRARSGARRHAKGRAKSDGATAGASGGGSLDQLFAAGK